MLDYFGYKFSTREIIPEGLSGVRRTLTRMGSLAHAGRRDPIIRRLAMHITRYSPSRDWNTEIDQLHRWVQNNIRYTRDPVDTLSGNVSRGIEYISTPRATLETRAGDCDDHAILLSSLLGSIGHPSRFVASGAQNPSHVYVETPLANHRWVSVETTLPVAKGWRPHDERVRMVHYAL